MNSTPLRVSILNLKSKNLVLFSNWAEVRDIVRACLYRVGSYESLSRCPTQSFRPSRSILAILIRQYRRKRFYWIYSKCSSRSQNITLYHGTSVKPSYLI